MSTYSHSQHFPESLAGLLKQTYSPLEIIVLVDGAHPESLALLERTQDPRLRFFTTPVPSGMIPAWNKVCSEAEGKYLLYCADDDVLLPHAIDKQVEQMERHTSVTFSHADFIYVDEAGTEIGRWVSPRGEFVRSGIEAWNLFVVQTRCCMQTTVVRRSIWEQVGGWDDDAGYPGDNSLYLKLLRLGAEGHVAHTACRYRVRRNHPDPPQKKFLYLQEHHALAKKHLDDPPEGLTVSLYSVRTKAMQHIAWVGLPLIVNTEDRVLGNSVADWMSRCVWPESRWRRLWPLLFRFHGLWILSIAMSIYRRSRGFAGARLAVLLRKYNRIRA
jgi:glycosyltransferase involved in cell wall biosynthesis